MRLTLLLALLAVLVSSVLCQYSCPLIDYTQSIEPVPSSLFPDSPAYKLSFVNRSPRLPLAFLDVHYAINSADTSNIRLVSSSSTATAAQTRPFPPFLLADDDQLDYWFTYGVQALGLACDTHHFQVTGKEVQEHATSTKETADTTDKAKDTDKEPIEKRTVAVDEQAKQDTVSVSADSRTLPTLHETNPLLVIPPLGLSDAVVAAAAPVDRDRIAPAVDRMAEPLDVNSGVCPLLPFTQQLARASSASSSLYTLIFHNQSPTLPLAFLDVHFAINSGPTANLRLFSDHTSTQPQPQPQHDNQSAATAGTSNEARGLDGIAMVLGDSIEYSFTYGVKEAGGMGGKVRACNTEVYKVKVDESIK